MALNEFAPAHLTRTLCESARPKCPTNRISCALAVTVRPLDGQLTAPPFRFRRRRCRTHPGIDTRQAAVASALLSALKRLPAVNACLCMHLTPSVYDQFGWPLLSAARHCA